MGKKVLISLFILLIMALSQENTHAQYRRMVYHSGIQPFENNNVSVSYLGPRQFLEGYYFCGVGPYFIGRYISIFNWGSPMSYTFDFSRSVDYVRIDCTSLYNTDAVTVWINGAIYTLTNGNLFPAPNNCSLNIVNAVIVGGNIAGVNPPAISEPIFSAGKLIIKQPAISSLTIEFTGILFNNGYSGSDISVYFGQINAANSGPVCAGDRLRLWGDTTIAESGEFHWQGPNGYTSMEQNPIIYPFTHQDTGIYTLTYIKGVDTFTDTTHVSILPSPPIPIINADSPVCAGTTLHLSTTATTGANYFWSGPGGFSANGASVTRPDMQRDDNGKYTVMATIAQCSPSFSKLITVTQPVVRSFTELTCSNTGYDFNGRLLHSSGIYTDTFSGSNGCDSINKLNLVVLPGPEVKVIYDNTRLCIGDTVILHALGNTLSYDWLDIENYSLGLGDLLPFVLQSFSNQVLLVGVADNECKDTFALDINAAECCELNVPNAFSPNNDGINDYFIAQARSPLLKYRLDIFNRWGNLVFSSVERTSGWDGSINGSPADVGTYHYLIQGDCARGTHFNRKGDLVLIR